MANLIRNLRIALIQTTVTKDIRGNIMKTMEKIEEAATKEKANLVVLQECFNCQCAPKEFIKAAEDIPTGFASSQLSKHAKELGIHIVGGSIPEIDPENKDKLYNTVTVWNPEGELMTKYRKLHSFDVNIPDLVVNESESFSKGKELITFDIGEFRAGLGICYDMRFEEMAKALRFKGCNLLIYPAAFSLITGPAHWEVLQRARAIDNQCYVATISPSKNPNQGYVSYGHSMIVDPWGDILNSADENDSIVAADMSIDRVQEIRERMPVSKQRRTDVYDLVTRT